jgi:hypothetical protein
MVLIEYLDQKSAVPAGCETCVRVKVVLQLLRESMAVYEAGGKLPFTFQCGIEEGSEITASLCGVYFSVHGLPAARAANAKTRRAVNAHPKLGVKVTVFMKRGCTEYEVQCCPSDQYTFTDEQRQLEARLRPLVQIGPRVPETRAQIRQTFAHWIRTAYGLGDETYLDVTGGRRLYPAVVRYAPQESVAVE